MLEENRILLTLNVIERIYCILVILGIGHVVWTALNLSGIFERQEVYVSLLTVVFDCLILWGLKVKKEWIVQFIIIISAFMLFKLALIIAQPATDHIYLAGKALSLFLFIFYGYQILFFSKYEVRKYFEAEGVTIF